MKRNLTIVLGSFVVFFALITFSFKVQSDIVEPPSGGLANDPGQSNCAACHSNYGPPIARNSQFVIRIAPDSAGLSNDSSIINGSNNFYTPNHPNWVSFYLTGVNTNFATDSAYYGFQFTALKTDSSMAGSFTLVDPNTSSQSSPYAGFTFYNGPRSYVSHYNPYQLHTINTWHFVWNAPDSSAGPVTFYYSGNLADGYGLSAQPTPPLPYGDTIFVGYMTLTPGPSSALGIANINSAIHYAHLYPVPLSNELTADMYLLSSSYIVMTMLSTDGQIVKELYCGQTPQGQFSQTFDTGDIAAGVYLVRILSGTDSKTIKVLKY
jgi:hypothetical protein